MVWHLLAIFEKAIQEGISNALAWGFSELSRTAGGRPKEACRNKTISLHAKTSLMVPSLNYKDSLFEVHKGVWLKKSRVLKPQR